MLERMYYSALTTRWRKGGLRTVLSKRVWAAYQKPGVLGKRAQEPLEALLKVDNAG
jgi:hypothetical protein